MNFDLKNTTVYRAIKRESFLIFKFSVFLKNFFLLLFVLSLLLVAFSFLNLVSLYFSVKVCTLFFVLYLIFWNLSLFTEFKIKKTAVSLKMSEVAKNPENYNLAELLSFNSAKIINSSLKNSDRRKRIIDSNALFYSAVRESKDIQIICSRLGLSIEKLKEDLKNRSEKAIQKTEAGKILSDDFEKTILHALSVANSLGNNAIGEKEILVGLANYNEFFKKTLVEFDLKKEDVENLALWLSSAEKSIEASRKFWSRENLARAGSVGRDWASGYTVILDQFSTDWSRVVSRWAFKEIIGHQKEIESVEMVLARSNLSNALIIGEPGTGRKSIIEALALKCYLGKSLPELNNKRVVELDLVQLSARIQNFEKLETTLDQIFSEAVTAGNVILVIDELHNFVGQKGQKPGSIDISGILSKYLAVPNLKFAAITTYDGLHRSIEKNRSFVDFFRKIEVSEITEQETIKLLLGYALDFEQKNKILILYPSIREIVNLTARYVPSLPFPKKAIDVLDEAVVYLQTLKENVLMPHHIAEIISQKTEIPIGKMDVKEKEVLLNLEKLIHQRIVNQEEAVKQISIAMRRARSGIGHEKRPMGTFLFMGPTGVGKTETSKALAKIYFGSEEKMVRLDMSEFQAISDIPRLIGAVSPVEMQGLLTTPVRETPFSLVLMDEIEKAHPDILNLLLQVLDEGHITDGQGRKVVFTNTIIICTSNAGAEIIFKQASALGGSASGGESGEKLDKEKFISYLVEKNLFRPEFINRFDATVVFHPLTKENLSDISELMLKGLKKKLKEKEINFEITQELKEKIVELSYKPEFGAREMRRVIQDSVENTVAEALLSEKIKKGDTIEINPENFEIVKISRG